MSSERWSTIPEFPSYSVSDKGNIYHNVFQKEIPTSQTQLGHVKVSLRRQDGERRTMSVAKLVAEAFVIAPDLMCDHVIVRDGVLTHVMAANLEWRPWWFCIKYAKQLRVEPFHYYVNLPIYNLTNRRRYKSIVACGIREGLLFEDIWDSTHKGKLVYPHGYTFKVIH